MKLTNFLAMLAAFAKGILTMMLRAATATARAIDDNYSMRADVLASGLMLLPIKLPSMRPPQRQDER
jgi:hypothetical protein